MRNKNKTEGKQIFLSWSGIQSRKLANEIKDFLSELFRINKDDIFFSDYTLGNQYTENWLDTVKNAARECEIMISCITNDNIESPWIHYELGLSSGKIVPLLFDIKASELPRFHVEMISATQVIADNENNNSVEHYKNLLLKLARLLFCVFSENKNYSAYIAASLISSHDNIICEYNKSIFNKYAKKLCKILRYYSDKRWFISRPFNTDESLKNILQTVFKGRCDVNISDLKDDVNSVPESRREQIEHSKGFIMIYPNIDFKTPSSCLIELGIAFAFNLDMHILVQKDAQYPKFISYFESLKSGIVTRYSDNDELSSLLSELTKVNNTSVYKSISNH